MSMGPKVLLDLFWRYSNDTRLPIVEGNVPSDLDVYVERYAGIAGTGNITWRRVLHFNRTQPSARNYTCVANYSGKLTSQSVEVRITGG